MCKVTTAALELTNAFFVAKQIQILSRHHHYQERPTMINQKVTLALHLSLCVLVPTWGWITPAKLDHVLFSNPLSQDHKKSTELAFVQNEDLLHMPPKHPEDPAIIHTDTDEMKPF